MHDLPKCIGMFPILRVEYYNVKWAVAKFLGTEVTDEELVHFKQIPPPGEGA